MKRSPKRIPLGSLFLAAFLMLGGCGEDGTIVMDGDLTATEAVAMILENANDENFVVIDARTASEYETGHIDGAINMDYMSGAFENDLGELDTSKKYLLYCASGARSTRAAELMGDAGFPHVYKVTDGYAVIALAYDAQAIIACMPTR
jgi:rhodanese-related sulfurtransferase